MTKDELKQLEANLWKSADSLRANSDLKASEYSAPVLGLIFLKFADNIYKKHEAAIEAEYQKLKGSRGKRRFMRSQLKNAVSTYLQRPDTSTC